MDSQIGSSTSNTPTADTAKKHVLLIEDEFFIADLYKNILTNAGFEVALAQDGDAGLKLAQGMPKLILLDIMLPKVNGVKILSLLKSDEKTRHIPVILLTNLGQADVIQEAFKIGAQGYLLKMHLNPADLVKYVNDFIANPNLKMDVNSLVLD